MGTKERLLSVALKRRVVACLVASSVVAAMACILWSVPLWVLGLRVRLWDPVAAFGFGVSTVLVVAAEHVVLSPEYFAARQPWRRIVATLATLSAACLPLGFVAGSCLQSRLAATVAAWRHACIHCVSSSLPVQRLGDVDAYAFVASRVAVSAQCAALAAACHRLRDQTPFASAFLMAWHCSFLTDSAISLTSTLLGACLLEPLSFEVLAARSPSTKNVDLFLTALEIGDAGSADDDALRHAVIKRSAPSSRQQQGWYASPARDPFDANAADTSAPLWRREIDAQRFALWNLVVNIDPQPRSPLAMPPILSLGSGGVVLGSASQLSFELRLAKYLALASLAQAAADSSQLSPVSSAAECIVAAATKNGGEQQTFAVSRALRACLLLIDAFTLRLEIASANPPPPQLESTSKLTATRFDSIATRLRASKYATRYYFDDTSVRKTATAENPSALEVSAVASATTALFPLACDHRVPVAICSILGARRALWEWRPTQPRLDTRNLQLLLDATLDRFCIAHADALPGFAFPTVYAPDLQRRIDALANASRTTSNATR